MSSHDNQSREYAKLTDLRAGNIVELDDNFTCHNKGKWTTHLTTIYEDGKGRLFFYCEHGKHFLSGQTDDDDVEGYCVGVYRT
jgi:hypothetical protein